MGFLRFKYVALCKRRLGDADDGTHLLPVLQYPICPRVGVTLDVKIDDPIPLTDGGVRLTKITLPFILPTRPTRSSSLSMFCI